MSFKTLFASTAAVTATVLSPMAVAAQSLPAGNTASAAGSIPSTCLRIPATDKAIAPPKFQPGIAATLSSVILAEIVPCPTQGIIAKPGYNFSMVNQTADGKQTPLSTVGNFLKLDPLGKNSPGIFIDPEGDRTIKNTVQYFVEDAEVRKPASTICKLPVTVTVPYSALDFSKIDLNNPKSAKSFQALRPVPIDQLSITFGKPGCGVDPTSIPLLFTQQNIRS